MNYEKRKVTPKLASVYLEANTKNRSIKQHLVKRYSNDMKNGRWKANTAEFIKISKTGQILDGQHRLLAIIDSGVSIWLEFALELEDAIFSVLDTGSSRNATDVFKVDGIKNANKVPAIISFFHSLNTQRTSEHLEYKLTNTELLNEYHKKPLYWQDITRISTNFYLDFSKILSPSFIGGFLAYFELCNEAKSLDFMSELTSGLGLTNKSIGLLRQKLISDKLAIKKMPKNHKIAVIIKTWNYYNKGKEVKIIHYNPKKEKKPLAFCVN